VIVEKDIRTFSESSHNGRDGKENQKADAAATLNHSYVHKTNLSVTTTDKIYVQISRLT